MNTGTITMSPAAAGAGGRVVVVGAGPAKAAAVPVHRRVTKHQPNGPGGENHMKNNEMKSAAAQTQTQSQAQAQTQAAAAAHVGIQAEVTPFAGRRYKEVFMVEDSRVGGRGFWTKIGVAFETKNGNLSLKLSAVPVAGNRLYICDPKPRAAPAPVAANDDVERAAA
jgi:hypothetical protein